MQMHIFAWVCGFSAGTLIIQHTHPVLLAIGAVLYLAWRFGKLRRIMHEKP